MTTFSHFEVQQCQDVTVIHLIEPEISEAPAVKHLRDELVQFVETANPHKLLVNFGRVERFPTAALGGLLKAKQDLVGPQPLKCCGMNDRVQMASRFLKLEGTFFDIYDTPREAIAAF